jgi:hypothetical protein
MEMSGLLHAPATLPPVPIGQEGWVGPRAGLDAVQWRKILLPLQGIEPRRPASSYTEWNIAAHIYVTLYAFIDTSVSTTIQSRTFCLLVCCLKT